MNEDPIMPLCRLVVGTSYEDLPVEIVDFAKKHILDTFGAILGGSSREGVSDIVRMVSEQGGRPQAVVPCFGVKVPAALAALAIGPMARALDTADCHDEAGHSAEYVLPALLGATGLRDVVSGKDFIVSFVVGQEVLVRIGCACKQMSKGATNGYQGGHYLFGAVAAVAKLMGLTLEQTVNAMGIALATTQPHDETMYCAGSMMVYVHHGLVSQAAVTCCLLARSGITGPHNVLNGGEGVELGYIRQFCRWDTDPGILTDRLGSNWMMTGTTLKAYASPRGNHAAAEAAIRIMDEHDIRPAEVSEIRIYASTLSYNAQCVPGDVKWNPRTKSEAHFSMPYVVAVAAIDRKVMPAAFTEGAMSRIDVRDLMKKIVAVPEPQLPTFGSRVAITVKNGAKYTKEVLTVKGQPSNPLSAAEVVSKFRELVAYSSFPISDSLTDEAIGRILNLEKAGDVVADLLSLLAGLPSRQ